MRLKVLLCIMLMISLAAPAIAGSKSNQEIPDYSTTERKDVPDEYKWKISDLYASVDAWEKDFEELKKLAAQIDDAVKGWTGSAAKMLAFNELYGKIMLKGNLLYSYASNNGNMNLEDPVFQKIKGKLMSYFIKMRAKTASLSDDILKLGKEKFEAYVKEEPKLKPYAFNTLDTLRAKAHVLPAGQQRVASSTGLFANTAKKSANILRNLDLPKPTVKFSDGKEVVLNYANFSLYRAGKNRADRNLANKAYWENYKKFEKTLATLLDGGMKTHLFTKTVFNYQDCLDARLFGDNIDPAVYHTLIKSVRANLKPFHRYLTLKKELLGLDKFVYADVYASAVKSVDKKYPYAEAQKIILKMMKVLGKEYTETLKTAFNDGWIDRYPNKGKQTGAYSSGIYGMHPFIKMNYNGTYDNVSTLAHELGHAAHSFLSNKNQHQDVARYPTFLAEIASTFNENVLIDYLLKNEKDDLLKLFVLDAFIQQIKGTIYRQTQFAEFELAMHREVEKGGTLTAEWLNAKYLELARYYYGHKEGVCEVGDYIQCEWASVPHFYLNYYVYTYSTGMIASMALSDMVLNGKKAEMEKYLTFLKTGGSKYPLDTLKLAGVDMTSDVPFNAAFKRFSKLVDEMEKIVKRLKKAKKI